MPDPCRKTFISLLYVRPWGVGPINEPNKKTGEKGKFKKNVLIFMLLSPFVEIKRFVSDQMFFLGISNFSLISLIVQKSSKLTPLLLMACTAFLLSIDIFRFFHVSGKPWLELERPLGRRAGWTVVSQYLHLSSFIMIQTDQITEGPLSSNNQPGK